MTLAKALSRSSRDTGNRWLLHSQSQPIDRQEFRQCQFEIERLVVVLEVPKSMRSHSNIHPSILSIDRSIGLPVRDVMLRRYRFVGEVRRCLNAFNYRWSRQNWSHSFLFEVDQSRSKTIKDDQRLAMAIIKPSSFLCILVHLLESLQSRRRNKRVRLTIFWHEYFQALWIKKRNLLACRLLPTI